MSLGGSKSTTRSKYNEKATNQIVDKQSGTKTSSSDISAFQKPYIEGGFEEALKLYQGGDTSALTALLNSAMGAAGGAQEQAKSYLTNAVDKADSVAAMERARQAGQASVNDPTTAALIDANARGITRNLTEEALPAIMRGAVGAGASNSSRTGIAEGLARGRTAEALADNASRVNASAYDRGYNSSLAADAANTNALFSASAGLQNLFNSGVSAAQLQQQNPWNNFGNLWNVLGGNVWGTNNSESFNQNREGSEVANTTGNKTDKTSQWGFSLKL